MEKELKFKTTREITIPPLVIDHVIGQEAAVNLIKKAARQRRHVLLIGEPGTGKSLLGIALAQLLPKEKLADIVSFSNPNDENQPLIRVLPAGQGREVVARAKAETAKAEKAAKAVERGDSRDDGEKNQNADEEE